MLFPFTIFFMLVFSKGISAEPLIITLNQTPCKFNELDNRIGKITAASFSDCEKWNSDSITKNLEKIKTLELKEGQYTFRVSNHGIPYEVGFYLRGAGIGRIYLPSISGGGLFDGITKEYTVSLKKGIYKISCPLNPTPDYELIVK
ncbi:MAG: hypothetical protein SH817_15005 [Leptospira sp.]|nr:hypothetical protein [Leptospira sp.]